MMAGNVILDSYVTSFDVYLADDDGSLENFELVARIDVKDPD
jgi:hypothetical protein